MAWTGERLLKQIELGEDSRVEFKEVGFTGGRVSAPRRESVADELAALGNSVGGTVIFSVSDAGTVRRMDRRQMDALEAFVGELCSDSIHPPLAFITQRLALPRWAFRAGRRNRPQPACAQESRGLPVQAREREAGTVSRRPCNASFNSAAVPACRDPTRPSWKERAATRSTGRSWRDS